MTALKQKSSENESQKEDVIVETAEQTEAVAEPAKEEKLESIVPGIAYVFGSYNNTIVHITDLAGSTITRISGCLLYTSPSPRD